jgi:hypothetical protein
MFGKIGVKRKKLVLSDNTILVLDQAMSSDFRLQ